MTPSLDVIAEDIRNRAAGSQRFIVAIAGAPGSGKSTLADRLASRLTEWNEKAIVFPMDGYHMDNAVLIEKGLLEKKGAPDTFDVRAFIDTLNAIRTGAEEVLVPVFDRSREIAIASARIVAPSDRIILVEGNYLLLTEKPWSALDGRFDLTLFLDVPESILEKRLWERWMSYNYSHQAARDKIEGNDLPNGRHIRAHLRQPDRIIFVEPENPLAGYDT
jgi:pantothenate kinase